MTALVGHILSLGLLVAAIPVLAASVYLAVLAVLAVRAGAPKGRFSLNFDVIIPAHDEEEGIAATLASVLALDYPRNKYRVLVVADNCSDRTAELACKGGAIVIPREDEAHRGKGYAMAAGYERSFKDGFAHAVAVIDADTIVSPNLLSAFAARLEHGAQAVQAEYGVRNADSSWRTRLMVIAFTLFHTLRSLARERLGLSCGLRGNGMGFRIELLKRVPPTAFSLVEDVEYGMLLGLAGARVTYAAEASVAAYMPAGSRASRSQRQRWEIGRRDLTRKYLPMLLRESVKRRDVVLLDLAMDLVVPPLTTLAAAVSVGLALSIVAVVLGASASLALACWLASLASLTFYIARGLVLTGDGLEAVRHLSWAPVYAIWKLTLAIRPGAASRGEWIRTTRTRDIPT
jgi:1,2-diacylglycerol 3-beta-glucosyltransferase